MARPPGLGPRNDAGVAGLLALMLLAVMGATFYVTVESETAPVRAEARDAAHMARITEHFEEINGQLVEPAVSAGSAPLTRVVPLVPENANGRFDEAPVPDVLTFEAGSATVEVEAPLHLPELLEIEDLLGLNPLEVLGLGPFDRTYEGGSLIYQGRSQHFVDQTYRLEHGAVVLAQEGGAVLRMGPALSASLDGHHTYLALALPSLSSSDPSFGGGATGSVTLATRDVDEVQAWFPELEVTLGTSSPAAWAGHLEELLSGAGMVTDGPGCAASSGCEFWVRQDLDAVTVKVHGASADLLVLDVALSLTQRSFDLTIGR